MSMYIVDGAITTSSSIRQPEPKLPGNMGSDTPLPFWRKLTSSGKGQQIVGPISANKNHLTLPPNNQV